MTNRLSSKPLVASDDLKELAELDIKTERTRLATLRNGKARQQLDKILREAFLEKSTPDQNNSGPADQDAPEPAVVMSDGGGYQRFDRGNMKTESGSFWNESRLAILLAILLSFRHIDMAGQSRREILVEAGGEAILGLKASRP